MSIPHARTSGAPGAGRLIVALDTADPARAAAWAGAVAPHVGLLKLGLEFFLANGAPGVRAIAAAAPGLALFLDLKLHDIPATVAGAVRAVLPLAPRLLTLHAAGGAAMIAAARAAAETGGAGRPLLLAVTVLTSLDDTALAATGVAGGAAAQVLRLARLALAAGADGLVCSPLEVALLRAELGPEPKLVVPGIRPPGAARGDQARTLTPEAAVAAGADWIVVGRPITGAPDPGEAAAAIAAAIASAGAQACAPAGAPRSGVLGTGGAGLGGAA
ncbi:MAG: orotidine-5'-phosphate decarboxylase [Proteobacteria bacterium]|nr:orotidine-5'-phosphate decarboxylase [Pseudomonadota bacterium]